MHTATDAARIKSINILSRPPNQRLKLTEPAVGESAARMTKETEMNDCHVRAMNKMELAARRRSLAAVR